MTNRLKRIMEFQGAIWRAGREVDGEGKRDPLETGAQRGWTTEKPPAAEWLKECLMTFFLIVIF